MFYLGFFNAYFRTGTSDELTPLAPRNAVIEGQIVTVPKAPRFFFQVNKIDGKEVNAKTVVTALNQDFSQYEIGKFYRMSGRLSIPAKAGNPSQFDYRKYLRNFNTFTTFYAEETTPLEQKLTPRWSFINSLNNFRSKIIATHALYIQSPNLEVLGGIVFGDDAVQPAPEIKDSFRTSGLLHILAASGMNVAFIYGFWFFFLSKLRAPYRFTVISGILMVIFYTLMTGLGHP
jgi:competence protein ComEC